ncbi:MAG: DUF418 domain-containing protein [Chloroflexota bacterium]
MTDQANSAPAEARDVKATWWGVVVLFAAFGSFGAGITHPGAALFDAPVGPDGPSTVIIQIVQHWLEPIAGPILALVFGIYSGTVVQQGPRRRPGIKRASLGLLFVGLAHAVFVFAGDLLTSGGLLGLTLGPLTRLKRRGLIVVTAVSLTLPTALLVSIDLTEGDQRSPTTLQSRDQVLEFNCRQLVDDLVLQSETALGTGSYRAATAQRVVDFAFGVALGLLQFPSMVAAFSVGLLAATRGNPSGERLLRFPTVVVLPALLLAAFWSCKWVVGTGPQAESVFVWPWLSVAGGVTSIALLFAVLAIADKSIERFPLAGALLQALGRIPLTAYLATTITMTTLLYGYGFGLGQTMWPPVAPLMVLALCIGIAAAGSLWLSRFTLGPAEWVLASIAGWDQVPLNQPDVVAA